MHAEDVSLASIAALAGTPAYVYSANALRDAAQAFRAALVKVPRKQLMFAVKANPSLSVLRILADQNYGADIVSGGELGCALRAGITANHIIYSGVGKTAQELAEGLDAGISRFNLEHEREGQLLSALALERGKRAPALLRVNPDIDAGTHAKITTGRSDSKFGVPISEALAIYARLQESARAAHIPCAKKRRMETVPICVCPCSAGPSLWCARKEPVQEDQTTLLHRPQCGNGQY